jgi:hypothetical protein
MKAFITALILILGMPNSYAQRKYTTGTLQAVATQYIVTESKMYPNKYISIQNSKNIYTGKMQSTAGDNFNSEILGAKIDRGLLNKIFIQEVGAQLFQTLASSPDNSVFIQITFSPITGKALEVYFSTINTSPITPVIFENIENRIKKEITVTFSNTIDPRVGKPMYKTLNFYRGGYNIFFDRLKIN